MAPLGRLHVITDLRPGRDAVAAVSAALHAGAPVIQVRVPDQTTDREAYEFATRIRTLCTEHGATCLINDRLHIALAVGADGGHVGADDLPVAAARRRSSAPAAILGATCRDPAGARAAVADGATISGSALPTRPPPRTACRSSWGRQGSGAVAAAVPDTPVIAIGGVTTARVAELRAVGAYGVAVVSAVSEASDPAAATATLLAEVARHTWTCRPGRCTGVAPVSVAVVGAGVIGLAVAWRCAQGGLRVTLYDPQPGRGASRVAAGMLAPVSEAYFGESALTDLLVAAALQWPEFARELEPYGDVGFRAEGTLVVALTSDDRAEAERLWDYHTSLGLPITRLPAAELREREPALHPRVSAGALAPTDYQVDPRRLLAALRAAATAAGVEIVPRSVTHWMS